jgi:RNA polymerase sigma-70 factor, ECF subfamily
VARYGRMSALVHGFREAASSSDAPRPDVYDAPDLPDVLASLYARGRAAHPKLRVTEEAFGRCLARALAIDPCQRPETLAAEDLYLSCACAEGVRGAAAAFERQFAKTIRRATSRVLPTRDEREEAEQRARQLLLIGGGDRGPRIAEYHGRGSLEAWVSVAAIRVAISLGRSESAERRLQAKALAEATGGDPERMVMKDEIRREMETAVREALARLPPRDRLILGLFLVSGMTLQAIGKSLGITHQAVSKQIAKSRDLILEDIRGTVAERLKISTDELMSIMRLVASQLDASISRVLRKEDEP